MAAAAVAARKTIATAVKKAAAAAVRKVVAAAVAVARGGERPLSVTKRTGRCLKQCQIETGDEKKLRVKTDDPAAVRNGARCWDYDLELYTIRRCYYIMRNWSCYALRFQLDYIC